MGVYVWWGFLGCCGHGRSWNLPLGLVSWEEGGRFNYRRKFTLFEYGSLGFGFSIEFTIFLAGRGWV